MARTIEIARRGQITIPKTVREKYGIEDGKKYGLRALDGGIIVLTPEPGSTRAAIAELRDALTGKGASLQEMLMELRRLREDNVE